MDLLVGTFYLVETVQVGKSEGNSRMELWHLDFSAAANNADLTNGFRGGFTHGTGGDLPLFDERLSAR